MSERNGERIKCQASELLSLYGLLRHFVEVRVGEVPVLAPQRRSFDAACEMMDLLLQMKRGTHRIDVQCLAGLASRHLDWHIEAYGVGHVVPKHHWWLDIPAQLGRDSMVLDAFIIERQHLTVKAVAEHIKNTSVFERSLITSVCSLTANLARDAHFGNALLGGRAAPWLSPGAVVGPKMQTFGFTVTVHDVIFRSTTRDAGIVEACCGQEDHLFVMVDLLAAVARRGRHALCWKRAGRREVWPCEEVQHSLGWYAGADGSWAVLER